jgi:drug/metabolite transporter (DMT)-like permease
LVARFGFHESISPARWMGIALITAGVGFVAAGPSLTPSRKLATDVISQQGAQS